MAFIHDQVPHVFGNLIRTFVEALDQRHGNLFTDNLLSTADLAHGVSGNSEEGVDLPGPLFQQFPRVHHDQGRLIPMSDHPEAHDGFS